MEKNVNKIAYDISKLDISETDKLIDVLVNKYGIFANIYPYPVGIIPTAIGYQSQHDVYLKKQVQLN